LKTYLQSTAPGTSSPRNEKLGKVRVVMADYIRALRQTGNSAPVTLHGIHIYVAGEPVTLSELKARTVELNRRPR
jgi:Cu/Zn superoxide dismutase